MALDRAVEAYTPYLSAVVWNAMGASASAEDVEEVVSDAFLALWSSRERLDPERGRLGSRAAARWRMNWSGGCLRRLFGGQWRNCRRRMVSWSFAFIMRANG